MISTISRSLLNRVRKSNSFTDEPSMDSAALSIRFTMTRRSSSPSARIDGQIGRQILAHTDPFEAALKNGQRFGHNFIR